jgi:hypothetical protein
MVIDALDNLYLRVLSPSMVALVLSLLVVFFLWLFDPFIAVSALAFLLSVWPFWLPLRPFSPCPWPINTSVAPGKPVDVCWKSSKPGRLCSFQRNPLLSLNVWI